MLKLHFKIYWRLWTAVAFCLLIITSIVGWNYYKINVVSYSINLEKTEISTLYNSKFEEYQKIDDYFLNYYNKSEELDKENLEKLKIIYTSKIDNKKSELDTLAKQMENDLELRIEQNKLQINFLNFEYCIEETSSFETEKIDEIKRSLKTFERPKNKNDQYYDQIFENVLTKLDEIIKKIEDYKSCFSSFNSAELNKTFDYYIDLKILLSDFKKNFSDKSSKATEKYEKLVNKINSWQVIQSKNVYVNTSKNYLQKIETNYEQLKQSRSDIDKELKKLKSKYTCSIKHYTDSEKNTPSVIPAKSGIQNRIEGVFECHSREGGNPKQKDVFVYRLGIIFKYRENR